MPVAPSYQSYKQIGEPYQKNGKMYIQLQHPNTKKMREARFYTEQEWRRQFGTTTKTSGATELHFAKPLKEVLGFTEGYITIFKGIDNDDINEWFKYSPCTFTRYWGWSMPSGKTLDNLPAGITPITLHWADVSIDDNTLKPESQIKAFVESLLYEPSSSQHIGTIGERLTLSLTLDKDIPIDNGQYGTKHFYIFHDENGNTFTWCTQAKILSVGTHYKLKGTVSEHTTYKNEQQTKLLRCAILS